MLPFTRILCLAILLASADFAHAALTCEEKTVFAAGWEVLRDKGYPLERTQKLLAEDTTFSPAEKKEMEAIVKRIYASSGDAVSRDIYRKCK